jgi:NTE family protein
MDHKTALVLSGGGGRGAYHIGVYRALVEAGWVEDGRGPDIIVGTSIGALNGAAIASGRTLAQLEALWRAMRTENVQTLSPEVPTLLRPVLKYVFRDVLTSEALDADGAATDHQGGRRRGPGLGGWISGGGFGQLFPPFLHIFDTTPWRHTLTEPQPTSLGPLHWVDWQRINSQAAPALTITATDVSSGVLHTFSNRTHGAHGAAPSPITIDHLMASASIPLIYPWTDVDQRQYWDGAVLANTPLEPVIELAGEAEVDTVVVMMSPWAGSDSASAAGSCAPLPDNLFQALARTLDWALAASY